MRWYQGCMLRQEWIMNVRQSLRQTKVRKPRVSVERGIQRGSERLGQIGGEGLIQRDSTAETEVLAYSADKTLLIKALQLGTAFYLHIQYSLLSSQEQDITFCWWWSPFHIYFLKK